MSGRVRLSALGTQDTPITGSPTYSHFLGIFKHHTNFAFDVREHPLIDAKVGKETICIIPIDVGDLLTNLTLRYQLFYKANDSYETPSGGNYDDPFTPNVGIHAIEYADLYIGGVLIERLTGDWIYMYHKYHTSDYNFRDSVVPLTTAKEEPYGPDENNVWKLRQMYVDLPFYFYNNLPASILFCKLTKQNCYVRIKFKSQDKIVRPYLNQYTSDLRIETASLLSTYAYLDYDELNYLKSTPMDQLITQMQLRRHDVKRTEDSKQEIVLRFQHPVKTMYFIAGRKSREFSYHDSETLIQYMLNTKFKNLCVRLNNTILFDESFSKLVYENSLTNSVSGINGDVSFDGEEQTTGVLYQLPTREHIASYSFAMYPLDNTPSGHLNFSRIIHQRCQIELDYTDPYAAEEGEFTEVQIYAKNYNILHYSGGLCGLKY
jgi:hypothetical protein